MSQLLKQLALQRCTARVHTSAAAQCELKSWSCSVRKQLAYWGNAQALRRQVIERPCFPIRFSATCAERVRWDFVKYGRPLEALGARIKRLVRYAVARQVPY